LVERSGPFFSFFLLSGRVFPLHAPVNSDVEGWERRLKKERKVKEV
jgi:hypothetical protein